MHNLFILKTNSQRSIVQIPKNSLIIYAPLYTPIPIYMIITPLYAFDIERYHNLMILIKHAVLVETD